MKGKPKVTGEAKRKSSQWAVAVFGQLLKDCEKNLSENNVVMLEDIRKIRRLQAEVAKGDERAVGKSINISFMLPLLDYYRRVAAKELNDFVKNGIPKTEKARKRMAENIRRRMFGVYEHFIRSTVRRLFTIRRDMVSDHVRHGNRVKAYVRLYGDPGQWEIPEALLSKNARTIYRYVLKAPLPKESNWHKRVY